MGNISDAATDALGTLCTQVDITETPVGATFLTLTGGRSSQQTKYLAADVIAALESAGITATPDDPEGNTDLHAHLAMSDKRVRLTMDS